MGAIINASINVTKLPKEKFIAGKDGAVWYNFTISITWCVFRVIDLKTFSSSATSSYNI